MALLILFEFGEGRLQQHGCPNHHFQAIVLVLSLSLLVYWCYPHFDSGLQQPKTAHLKLPETRQSTTRSSGISSDPSMPEDIFDEFDKDFTGSGRPERGMDIWINRISTDESSCLLSYVHGYPIIIYYDLLYDSICRGWTLHVHTQTPKMDCFFFTPNMWETARATFFITWRFPKVGYPQIIHFRLGFSI